MKFAIGEEVTIKTTARSFWNGVKAKIVKVNPDEQEFPYDVILQEDTQNKHFTKGEYVAAFRESEFVTTAEAIQNDLEQAKALLARHGLAFRIYTREDVDKMLDSYGEDTHEPLDTKTFRKELVEFIMGGKDWQELSRKGFDDDTMLWMMVEGAHNDHPEWFVS